MEQSVPLPPPAPVVSGTFPSQHLRMEGADRVSRSVWQTDHHLHHHQQQQQPPSLNSIRSDSGMNSMEYWDYTVELECIGQTAGSLPSLPAEYFVQNASSVSVLSSSAPRSMGLTIDPNFYFWIVHKLTDLMINKGGGRGWSVTH